MAHRFLAGWRGSPHVRIVHIGSHRMYEHELR